jgi:hypothetical protein
MNKRLKLFFLASVVVFTIGCKNESKSTDHAIQVADDVQPKVSVSKNSIPSDGKYPEMKFEKSQHDFGTIKQGAKVDYEFKFENAGEADLQITDAKGTCGCTVPDYPKSAISPGKVGIIKVSFNSTGKSGVTTKSVVLTSNCKEKSKILTITADIKVPSKTK